MRRIFRDGVAPPSALARELGGVPAGGGTVQSPTAFNPHAMVQQQVPQQQSSGLSNLVSLMGNKMAQDKADYAPVAVDWNQQSDLNRGRMADMYASELANPTGILPSGSSAPSMIKPQASGGFMNSLKGLFGGGA